MTANNQQIEGEQVARCVCVCVCVSQREWEGKSEAFQERDQDGGWLGDVG